MWLQRETALAMGSGQWCGAWYIGYMDMPQVTVRWGGALTVDMTKTQRRVGVVRDRAPFHPRSLAVSSNAFRSLISEEEWESRGYLGPNADNLGFRTLGFSKMPPTED